MPFTRPAACLTRLACPSVCAAGKGSLDNINLFSIITILSFVLLLPVAVAVEGVRFTPAALAAMGVDPAYVIQRALVSAACFHAYQQVRLQGEAPVPRALCAHRALPCLLAQPHPASVWAASARRCRT
jgi:hypothetical protein